MTTEATLPDRAREAGIIPVLVIDELDTAVPLAAALRDGGLRLLELTLRTPVALAAIGRIRAALPDVIVGAGTVTSAEAAAAARDAGAQFAVSPGYSGSLGSFCRAQAFPLLPGVATPSEVMAAMADGHDFLKLFPASVVGGVALLEALRGPFPGARFCPTGGVTAANAASYLALPNVLCVGGTWMLPRDAVQARDWERIALLARQALGCLPA